VGLGREGPCRRVVGQPLRVGVRERVDRVAQRSGQSGVGPVVVANRLAELLGKARDDVGAARVALRLGQSAFGQHGLGQRNRDRREIAEGLVERGDLEVGRIPEVRPDGVEDGVALFVRHDVRTVAGLDDGLGPRVDVAEEAQRLAIVVGVQVFARDGHGRQHRPRDPGSGLGQPSRPEPLSAVEREGDLPVQKLGCVGRVGARLRGPAFDAKSPGSRLGLLRRRDVDEPIAAALRVVQVDADPRVRFFHGMESTLSELYQCVILFSW
jgi:hypothetical protein